jgi:antagonist of KipI
MSIAVLTAGLLTTVQDLGRHGRAAIGVGTSGAMDSVALRIANILVDNVENAPTLEITLRGPRLRFDRETRVAITGAEIDAHCGDQPLPLWRPFVVRAGSEIMLGSMRRGARAYLAVAGGFDATPILGSASDDINAGFGRPLAAGDVLSIASSSGSEADFTTPKWSIDPTSWFHSEALPSIRVIAGPHFDRLDEPSRDAFFQSTFRISADSNRVGYRLEGPALALRAPLELISEGVVSGTMQLPPGGAPIVLMAEAPTTGGYPRIGQVASVDLPRLGQLRPGDTLRFTPISLADAQTRYLEREQTIAALSRTIRERLHNETNLRKR